LARFADRGLVRDDRSGTARSRLGGSRLVVLLSVSSSFTKPNHAMTAEERMKRVRLSLPADPGLATQEA
jgi:hypothetical protein